MTYILIIIGALFFVVFYAFYVLSRSVSEITNDGNYFEKNIQKAVEKYLDPKDIAKEYELKEKELKLREKQMESATIPSSIVESLLT